MEITIERVIFLVIIAVVIDARVSKNTKAEYTGEKNRNSKTKNNTKVDVVDISTSTKRDIQEDLISIPVNNNNNFELNNNEPLDLSELLNEKLKALVDKDDATKLEFIKNIKEVLDVNSYENKEDDAIEALRGGGDAEYAIENSVGRRASNAGNLATLGFDEQGLSNPLPLLPARFDPTALRRGFINHPQFNRIFVKKPKSYQRILIRDIMQTQPNQANLHIPKPKIQATIQQTQSNLPFQPIPSLPLQGLETETVMVMNMNHQKIHKPVFHSNDNAYPYEPIRKR